MRSFVLLLLVILLFSSCNNRNSTNETSPADQAASLYHATRFRLESHDGYRKLIISDPWQDTDNQKFIYFLVPRGTALPDSVKGGIVITVPVKRMICMSTTHIAMMNALGAEEAIVGISGAGLVYNMEIRDAVKSGVIPDVGYENNLDKELIVSLKPNLLMAYGVGAASAEYLRKLSEMGITVMYNADYLEDHPLARCEWIKVFGILTGKETEADSIYNCISSNYMKLADSLNQFKDYRPKVLLGAPWEDVWYISPANSFAARLISDAGGSYLFGDLKARNSIPFSTEAVFGKAMDADVWLNPGTAECLGDITATDYRMAQLPVFKSGRVYNCNKRAIPGGGNDYWESAVVHPDILLRDLATVLHPTLMPEYSTVYYRKME